METNCNAVYSRDGPSCHKNIIPIKGESIEQRMEVNYLSCKQGVVSHKLEKKCQEEETYLKIITK